ncbi:DNA polymerase III subunit delta' [Effusibacillus dendaii]|uniref:DNA polymerase III subunit delta' n=2 Tax=Effusibacillus dendaii TaxID=2743772 RepID=A0A7I8DBS3_9BACL|nr:DNA polymerase III subunit delta' [Effusibacillus dendaii]
MESFSIQLLKQILTSGRLAHAYLFTGPDEMGMKAAALYFAKGIFCMAQNLERPCGQCSNCRRIENGNYPDLVVLEPDGPSIKIQQVREIQKSFALKAMEGNRKVYIITRADLMTVEAANALLKFLEEPSTPITAILLSNRKESMLPTIVSRCQFVPFFRMPVETIQQILQAEGISVGKAKLAASIRQTVDSAKQLTAYDRFAEIANLVIQLTEEIHLKRGNPLFLIQDKIIKPDWSPEDVETFLDCLAWWYRDLLLAKLDITDGLVYENQHTRIQSQAALYDSEHLAQMVEVVLLAKKRLQSQANRQLMLERMVLQLQGEF